MKNPARVTKMWSQTRWQISKDLPACIQMEAGSTLGLTAGYQTDMLTYFLPLERASRKKTNKWVTFCLFSCWNACRTQRGFNNDISLKRGWYTWEGTREPHERFSKISAAVSLCATSILQQETFDCKKNARESHLLQARVFYESVNL